MPLIEYDYPVPLTKEEEKYLVEDINRSVANGSACENLSTILPDLYVFATNRDLKDRSAYPRIHTNSIFKKCPNITEYMQCGDVCEDTRVGPLKFGMAGSAICLCDKESAKAQFETAKIRNKRR